MPELREVEADLDDEEERQIARMAAAVARVWTGETKWTVRHYIQPPERPPGVGGISDPKTMQTVLIAWAQAAQRAKKGRSNGKRK